MGGPVPTISGDFSGSYTPVPGPTGPGPLPINLSQLSSINLSIAGFNYTTADVGLQISFTGSSHFLSLYGLNNGVNAAGFTNDFGLDLFMHQGQAAPLLFYYTTPTSNGFFDIGAARATYDVRSGSTSVPDSGNSIVLFGLAVAGMSVGYRRVRAVSPQGVFGPLWRN
jgi:hypothetical protein